MIPPYIYHHGTDNCDNNWHDINDDKCANSNFENVNKHTDNNDCEANNNNGSINYDNQHFFDDSSNTNNKYLNYHFEKEL